MIPGASHCFKYSKECVSKCKISLVPTDGIPLLSTRVSVEPVLTRHKSHIYKKLVCYPLNVCIHGWMDGWMDGWWIHISILSFHFNCVHWFLIDKTIVAFPWCGLNVTPNIHILTWMHDTQTRWTHISSKEIRMYLFIFRSMCVYVCLPEPVGLFCVYLPHKLSVHLLVSHVCILFTHHQFSHWSQGFLSLSIYTYKDTLTTWMQEASGEVIQCIPSQNKINHSLLSHDDIIKWKHVPRYWPFVWGIHR